MLFVTVAVMEELTVVKAPVFRFSLSHGQWLVALANGPYGYMVQYEKVPIWGPALWKFESVLK